jgi:hypothetical protein
LHPHLLLPLKMEKKFRYPRLIKWSSFGSFNQKLSVILFLNFYS